MPKIILLQGPPASGKSTWRKEYIENNPYFDYINADELRLQYPQLQEHEIQEMQWNKARRLIDANISFIVDNTNLNFRTVNRWRELARMFNCEFEIKQFLDIPFYEAVKRDSVRVTPVGRSVIFKMYVDAGIYSASKKDAIIFDIDGTLADIEHRRHFVAEKKDWKSFFNAMPEDTINPSVKYIYDLIVSALNVPSILFVSGRPSEYRKQTEEWLVRNDFIYYDFLLMRDYRDKRRDDNVKEDIYKKYIEPFYNVKIIFDDRNNVVDMWRRIGLSCFQVNYGNF